MALLLAMSGVPIVIALGWGDEGVGEGCGGGSGYLRCERVCVEGGILLGRSWFLALHLSKSPIFCFMSALATICLAWTAVMQSPRRKSAYQIYSAEHYSGAEGESMGDKMRWLGTLPPLLSLG